MADLYSLQSTLAPQDPQFVFSEKQVIYVPDSNNGSLYNEAKSVPEIFK